MYVSDVIGDSFQMWPQGSTVFLKAPTGAGKTTFIMKKLLPWAITYDQEILYLSNRKILHQQLVKELCEMFGIPYENMKEEKKAEFKGITLMTYQTLQELFNRPGVLDPPGYFRFVVADEIHYLAEDSEFNPKIPRIKSWLIHRKRDTLIAISATLEAALPYLNFYDGGWQEWEETEYCKHYMRNSQEVISRLKGIPEELFFYDIPADRPQYVVFVYKQMEDIVEIINKDDTDEKWLIFQSNKERAGQIIRNIKCGVAFVTAEEKKSEVMRCILENTRFEEKVLVTTKVLDNGVSLHDPLIKHVVLDTISQTEFLQMLGRRRKQKEEEVVNIYIPQKSVQFFSGVLNTGINPALELMKKSNVELLEQIFRSSDTYEICRRYFDVKEGKLVLNPIAEQQLRIKKCFCEQMKSKMTQDEYAFVREQLKWLKQDETMDEVCFLSQEKENAMKEKLQNILSEAKEKLLGKEEQQIFRKAFTECAAILVPSEISHKKREIGLKKINEILEKMNLSERVTSIPGKKKGEETLWCVKE